jgi:uncharacterized membrane protein
MTRRRWLWITMLVLLGVSLAANFFLVGYVVHDIGRNTAAVVLDNIAGDYPPEVRQEFRKVMRENRPRTFTVLRDLRAARRGLGTAANATPYDAAAVENAMKDVRSATAALQQAMQDYLLTALQRVRARPPASNGP